ncbi:MAG: prolyl oligopeptidase family serine peptidase [Pseudomonadales bacterium]|nr:prolyl oligopeptidase family serine peptidase [Pseudomonadales bacterium]
MKTLPLIFSIFCSLWIAQSSAQDPLSQLSYISPENESIAVGQAGDDPADIGRYLSAIGAQAAQLSPDGSKIAYRYSVTGAPQLWVVPIQGGQMQQLTFGNGIRFFRWTPDSRQLLYGADNDGNEQESYALIDANGSNERIVLPPISGGFRSFGDFSKDGRTIYFASTERNGLDYDIYRADLATSETELIFEGTFGYFVRSLSPDGKHLIVSETVGEDSDNLFLLDTSSGELTTISAPDPRANHTDGGFAWTNDSSSFYLATNLDREFTALTRYDLNTKRFINIASTSHDMARVQLCGENANYLAWTENVDGFHRLKIRNLSSGSDLQAPSLPEGIYTLSCSKKSNRLVITTNGWRTPGDIHSWDLASGQLTQNFKSNLAGLDPDRLVRPESIRITARDGVELQGLLYLPDSASRIDSEAPPVVFEVHGGPTGQSVANFDAVVQYHVDRGVAVFEPNVRGSIGFGRTYVTLDDRTKRLDSVRDLIDMLDFFRDDGRVDPDRAAVSGGSYGGYMVNAVLAAYPGYFKAGVSRYGVADWITALEIASPALKASDRIEYGDIRLPEWRSFYEVNSPIRQAGLIDVPVLYSHGVMDPRIDIAETETMVSALRDNGVEAPFILIPDEGHGWRKMSNRLFYYRRQAEFLESQLSLD